MTVQCARCGQVGHLPAACSWPTDTEDLPEPEQPKPEPQRDTYMEWLAAGGGSFFHPKGTP